MLNGISVSPADMYPVNLGIEMGENTYTVDLK